MYLRVQRNITSSATFIGGMNGYNFPSHTHPDSGFTSTQVAFRGQSSLSLQKTNGMPSEFTRTAIMSKSRICGTRMLVGFLLLVIPLPDGIKAVCIYNVIWQSRGGLKTNRKQSIISCHPSFSKVKTCWTHIVVFTSSFKM